MPERTPDSLRKHSSLSVPSQFVSVKDGLFSLGGKTHRFIGANLWCAAYLGADAHFGDRERLKRELDRLSELGVENLRILAASELSPLTNSVRPAFRGKGGRPNRDLFEGLDFALAEMKARGQRAVLYLTNFWEWSGGMMTYLYWTNGGHYVDMGDPAHPWPAFPDFAARFYASGDAVDLYQEALHALVTRTNSVTGQRYLDDPTLFAWQLCNEPRPGASDDAVERHIGAYVAWIQKTASLIKALDPNHLVSTGSEGLVGSANRADYFVRAHDIPEIDYLTAHIWPQNWNWVTPDDLAGTFPNAERLGREYLAQHVEFAERLGRPLVIEEFGFPRDEGRFDPESETTFRDRFYSLIYDEVLKSARARGPLSGSNFWAFGGEGQAAHDDYRWRPGESNYLGDPPHEPQGWYSVFDSDTSTLELISAHSASLKQL
jgi:mannan endo-1,4-beta-mannosidase